MAGVKHVGIFWHPSPSDSDKQLVREWGSSLRCTEIVLETDYAEAERRCDQEKSRLAFVVAAAGESDQSSGSKLLSRVVQARQVFTVLFSKKISADAESRLAAADAGVHMVSHRTDEIRTALQNVTEYPPLETRCKNKDEYRYDCPVCGLQCLDAHSLWVHMPLFHVGVKKKRGDYTCPICNKRPHIIVVHIHDEHAPPGHPTDTSRSGIGLYSFGLVVVRRRKDNKFLAVQEYSSQGYWLPGGGIDAGELPTKAARRECIEEVGVKIALRGVLRIEVTPHDRYCRMRYIFYGEPVDEDDCEPKTLPDFESAGACWVTAEEVRSGRLRLRGQEPLDWFDYVDRGGTIHDMSLLSLEGEEPPSIPAKACC